MHFNDPFVTSDILRADGASITPHMVADATYEGIHALHVFHISYLKPLLEGLLSKTSREETMVGFHLRIVGCLAALRKLDGPVYVQAIASTARTIFELGLDMALLAQDPTNDSLERLSAFTCVERHRVAQKLVSFYSSRPLPANLDLDRQRQVCADPNRNSQVEALREKYWKRNRKGDPPWPTHWSRFQNARDRARCVNGTWEERYVRSYYTLSWHVHGGLVGVEYLPQNAFVAFTINAFQLATDVVLDSYRILGLELQLSKAMPQWAERLEFLDHVIGLTLVDKRLQSLGEPVRFCYLEENEKGFA